MCDFRGARGLHPETETFANFVRQAAGIRMSLRPSGPEWVLSESTLHGDRSRNAELLDCAKRAWPRIASYVRRQFNDEIPADERDRLAVETWEAVLRSVSKTLMVRKKSEQPVLDLDAYLVGAFQHRFIRAVRKEKRRNQIVEATSPEELEKLANARSTDWAEDFERRLQISQIVATMDPWARDVWASYQYGYSWRQIAQRYGLTEQQAKMRFRYAILKARKRITETSRKDSPTKPQRESES